MDNDLDTIERPFQSVLISHITDKEPKSIIVKTPSHLGLFPLVSTEDNELSRLLLAKYDLGKLLSEGSRCSRYQYNLVS